jgi:polyphosphate kinase 2
MLSKGASALLPGTGTAIAARDRAMGKKAKRAKVTHEGNGNGVGHRPEGVVHSVEDGGRAVDAREHDEGAPPHHTNGPTPKMKRGAYEAELRTLQGELVAMQEWVKATGAKVCIVFEGRDTAGKGGTIKRITERVSPRVFRVVALPSPTERERSQMYVQRYVPHFPAAGEVVIFDRSWYNRAGVERVMGFCTEEQTARFLDQVPAFERAMVDSGILLFKYWLEVSADEQTRRLESRINDPRKVWKLSDLDLKSYSRWYDYSRARDRMFALTDTSWAPWWVANTDDKKRGRLDIISHLLDFVPYDPLEMSDVVLPKRQKPGDYHEARLPVRHVPTRY